MKVLTKGAKGPEVTELQNLLYAAGQHIDRDGDFGPTTERAVRNFQQQHGLTVDGVVGPQTMVALRSNIGTSAMSDARRNSDITAAQLRQIMPQAGANADKFVGPLNAAMSKYGINTPARMAAFLAQVGHESGQLRYVREIWGPTPAQRRYEGRADLGNTQPGDGKRFMGRGLIQVTGRDNYRTYGRLLGLPLEVSPELLEQPDNAALSAAAYWAKNNLNALADVGDMRQITKIINGGYNGLDDRLVLWERAKKVLKC